MEESRLGVLFWVGFAFSIFFSWFFLLTAVQRDTTAKCLNMFGFICSLLLCVLFVIVFVLGCALPSPVVDRPKREVIGDDVVCGFF